MSRIRRFLAPLASLFRNDAVRHQGVTLPAKALRTGGSHFQDDDAFLSSAKREAERLQTQFGVTSESRILDVGCGFGRLPIGLLSVLGTSHYSGVDVNPTAVRWCRRYLQKSHPFLRVELLPVRNERYNPDGVVLDDHFRFPWEDQSFDVIYLYSVFSHMRSPDIRVYLREFARLLRTRGQVFLTAFVEEHVSEEEENPPDYRDHWKGALHCVRFERGFFEQLIADAGFRIDRLEYATETDGQSAMHLRKL